MLGRPTGERVLMSPALGSALRQIVPKQIYISIPLLPPSRWSAFLQFNKASLVDLCATAGMENYWRHLIQKTTDERLNYNASSCVGSHMRDVMLYFLFLGSGQSQATLRKTYPPAPVR